MLTITATGGTGHGGATPATMVAARASGQSAGSGIIHSNLASPLAELQLHLEPLVIDGAPLALQEAGVADRMQQMGLNYEAVAANWEAVKQLRGCVVCKTRDLHLKQMGLLLAAGKAIQQAWACVVLS